MAKVIDCRKISLICGRFNYMLKAYSLIIIYHNDISENMKVYQTNEIKNIALLGSKGSGKTTLA
uniref:hypothetical protein n=1 Tax=Duncaniella freteri TaxID=2530391 RepID=UPI002577C56E